MNKNPRYEAFRLAIAGLSRKLPELEARAKSTRASADAHLGDAWYELGALDAQLQYKAAKERHDTLVNRLKEIEG